MPSPTVVDPAILHAAQVTAQDIVQSLQIEKMMQILNYNVFAAKKFLLAGAMEIMISFQMISV